MVRTQLWPKQVNPQTEFCRNIDVATYRTKKLLVPPVVVHPDEERLSALLLVRREAIEHVIGDLGEGALNPTDLAVDTHEVRPPPLGFGPGAPESHLKQSEFARLVAHVLEDRPGCPGGTRSF
jgi:hypothetical protein